MAQNNGYARLCSTIWSLADERRALVFEMYNRSSSWPVSEGSLANELRERYPFAGQYFKKGTIHEMSTSFARRGQGSIAFIDQGTTTQKHPTRGKESVNGWYANEEYRGMVGPLYFLLEKADELDICLSATFGSATGQGNSTLSRAEALEHLHEGGTQTYSQLSASTKSDRGIVELNPSQAYKLCARLIEQGLVSADGEMPEIKSGKLYRLTNPEVSGLSGTSEQVVSLLRGDNVFMTVSQLNGRLRTDRSHLYKTLGRLESDEVITKLTPYDLVSLSLTERGTKAMVQLVRPLREGISSGNPFRTNRTTEEKFDLWGRLFERYSRHFPT